MSKSHFSIFHKEHIFITAIAAVIVSLMGAGYIITISHFNPVERAFGNFHMTDMFTEVENGGTPQDTSEMITIVDMSKVYSRARLAEIVNTIDSLKPAIMGVDIVFDGLRDDPRGNEILTQTVYSTSSPIIWAYELIDWNREKQQYDHTLHSFFRDPNVPLEEAYINVQRDETGGTIRSINIKRQTEEGTEYSMPARLAAGYTGDSTVLKEYKDCRIRYTATHFPIVPCDSIAEYAHLIKDNIVLLGAAKDRRDMHYTPLGHIPGVRIIALAAQTIINKDIPNEFPLWATILLSLFLVWLCVILASAINTFKSKSRITFVRRLGQYEVNDFIFFAYIVFLVWFDYLLFVKTNYFFNVTWVILSILLLDTASAIYNAITNPSHYK